MTASRAQRPGRGGAPVAGPPVTSRRAFAAAAAAGGLASAFVLGSCAGRGAGTGATAGASAAGGVAAGPPRLGRLPVHRFAVASRPAWDAEVGRYFAEVFQAALVDELRRLGLPADPAAGAAPASGGSAVDGRFVSRGPGGAGEAVGFAGGAAEVQVVATVRGPAGQTRQVEADLASGEGAVPPALLPSAILSERPEGAGLMATEKARLTEGARRAAKGLARRLAPALRDAGVPAAATAGA